MKFALAALAALFFLSSQPLAQSIPAFRPRPRAEIGPVALTDAQISDLLATLNRQLGALPTGTNWTEQAGDAIWQFARRIQSSRLTRVQEARVLTHLDELSRSRPEASAIVAGPRKAITAFGLGKTAPDIVGRDLDGQPMRLNEYRNKVVMLKFTADWCGICRAQAPYERFLLDKYARWPLAILAVEIGSNREDARQAHMASPVAHRVWWDEPVPPGTDGPITSAWQVTGWPATYLIDGDGVIQFVDVREESLLIAVRQLVEAQADRDLKAQRRK